MMKIGLILGVQCLFSFIVYGEESKFDVSMETVIPSIVYLHSDFIDTTDVDGRKVEIFFKPLDENRFFPKIVSYSGTGFLIQYNGDFFLVTADHVAKKTNRNTTITIRGEGDKPVVLTLDEISGKSAKPGWISHTTSDVAALKLFLDASQGKLVPENFFPGNKIAIAPDAPWRELPLTVMGFPLGLGVGEFFSPISKVSYAASGRVSVLRDDTKTVDSFFLLDSPSIGGFSGAPLLVFSTVYPRSGRQEKILGTGIVGIIHGTISDNTGGKLAAVTPGKRIVEILDIASK